MPKPLTREDLNSIDCFRTVRAGVDWAMWDRAKATIAQLEAELALQQSDFDSVWESRDQALRERDTLKAQLATVTSGLTYLQGWKQGAEESAEVMRREFHAAQAFGAEQMAEVERLRAGLDELAGGQCGSAYGNGCDGACQRFAGKVLRGEWRPQEAPHAP